LFWSPCSDASRVALLPSYLLARPLAILPAAGRMAILGTTLPETPREVAFSHRSQLSRACLTNRLRVFTGRCCKLVYEHFSSRAVFQRAAEYRIPDTRSMRTAFVNALFPLSMERSSPS
jgi:hypothetical protein